MREYVILGLVACISIVGVEGCSADQGEEVAAASDAIINGTPVTTDWLGTPYLLTDTGNCSSTMLNAQWLLTARHCVTTDESPNGTTAVAPSTITAKLLDGSSAVGASVVLHPSLDIALVKLNKPINPSPLYQSRGFYQGSSSSLVNKKLYCQGWGKNTMTTGAGLMSANLSPYTGQDGAGYRIQPNSLGQIQYSGDSGSACFIFDQGDTYTITGVVSSCTATSTNVLGCYLTGADAFRDWVTAEINPHNKGDTLSANQRLNSGDYLLSYDGLHKLIMQSDCNLVLYDLRGAPWYTGTWGRGSGCYAIMQGDGNFVVYTQNNQYVWDSGTRAGNRVVVQDDGNIVIYDDGRHVATWASHTVQ